MNAQALAWPPGLAADRAALERYTKVLRQLLDSASQLPARDAVPHRSQEFQTGS
jgi:hypothetical protein